MIYTAHQPDLLPYSGFFHKMAKADIFDLKIYDQFANRGYQRRVRMRGSWATLPLEKGSSRDPICVKKLQAGAAEVLVETIRNRYEKSNKAAYWDRHGPAICDEILSIKTDLLWEFNFRLLLLVRDILGLETPISISRPASPGLRGSDGIISVMRLFNTPMTYLSGTGAKTYMGDCQEFDDAGIPVIWSAHRAATGDSILTVLLEFEDPLATVLAEHEKDGSEAGHGG